METIEELLTRHEGKSLKPYKCPAGKKTIGYGRNIDAKPLPREMADYLKEHGEITNAMSNELLHQDILAAEAGCMLLFPDFYNFAPARRNALVDFVFNVGLGTARKFKKTVAAICLGDWDTAADEMENSSWYRQVGGRAREICEMIKNG